MKLAIFTLVEHIENDGKYYGYAPYVREIDLWNAHFNEVLVVAPVSKKNKIDALTIPYQHSNLEVIDVPVFNIKSIGSIFKLLFSLPNMIFKMVRAMRQADHLHFRSPSNIAAVAAVVQIFFPNKKKTMRYTGNWDPNSTQPIGYKFQKWLLSNSFLTKNMTALVYGNWPNTSKNAKPFFAATFNNSEKEDFVVRSYNSELKFVFLGALVAGKRPLLAIQIVELLLSKDLSCTLHFYGNGILKDELQDYISTRNLEKNIFLYGNKDRNEIKEALQQSHFTILPSKSEGWPKALAEGMFFGSIPISTKISCVDWMLGYGKRGILIEPNAELAVEKILKVLREERLSEMAKAAQKWSQKYTVEKQKIEIETILKN